MRIQHYSCLLYTSGSGIKRILNAAEEYGLSKPRFQEFDNMFRVELFRSSFPMTNGKENIGEASEVVWKMCIRDRFSIFPIQYMKNDELSWEDDFKDSGISLQDTSAEAREKQARQLFAFAKENNISGLTQETDTSGRTSFGELDEGIYPVSYTHLDVYKRQMVSMQMEEQNQGSYM